MAESKRNRAITEAIGAMERTFGSRVAMCHREHDPNRGRAQDAEG